MKRMKKTGLVFAFLGLFSGEIVGAAKAATVEVGGTLVADGSAEIRLENEYSVKRMKDKTLKLLVDGLPVDFEIKNVTESELKGANNSLIYKAFCEVLGYDDANGDSDEETKTVNLEDGGENYEKLLKILRSGKSTAEAVKLRLYDVSAPSHKTNVALVVGGSSSEDGNLTAGKAGNEDEAASAETSSTGQKKSSAVLQLINKEKDLARNVNISLNKLGKTVGQEAMSAVQGINPNSEVCFRFRDEAGKLMYQWQIKPPNVRSPQKINMGILFEDETASELMKKVGRSKFMVVKMQEYGDIGSKFKICVRAESGFGKEKIKLYSINEETGALELKDQAVKKDKRGMLCFETAFGGTYVVVEG